MMVRGVRTLCATCGQPLIRNEAKNWCARVCLTKFFDFCKSWDSKINKIKYKTFTNQKQKPQICRGVYMGKIFLVLKQVNV